MTPARAHHVIESAHEATRLWGHAVARDIIPDGSVPFVAHYNLLEGAVDVIFDDSIPEDIRDRGEAMIDVDGFVPPAPRIGLQLTPTSYVAIEFEGDLPVKAMVFTPHSRNPKIWQPSLLIDREDGHYVMKQPTEWSRILDRVSDPLSLHLPLTRRIFELAGLLSCSGVAVEQKAASAKLNKDRAGRGKPPLADVVVIKPSGGGSVRDAISSGRLVVPHFRRGHVRRHKGGFVHVRPCVVGVNEGDREAAFEALKPSAYRVRKPSSEGSDGL